MPERPVVFISHVSGDGEATRVLQGELDELLLGSVEFFNSSSKVSLKPGEEWFATLRNRLRECRFVLAILTPSGLRSSWVNFECGAAWLQGATIIPCCVGQVRKNSLPSPYNEFQAIELDSADDLSRLVAMMASTVGLRPPATNLTGLADRLLSAFQLEEPSPGESSALYDRISYREEREWRYRKAEHDGTRWGATYTSTSSFKVIGDDLSSLLASFSPSVETLPFSLERQPRSTILDSSRSSPGTVRLGEATKRTGSTYAFRIYFDPPLRRGDKAKVSFSVDFPEYRLGAREDYVAALLDAGGEVTDIQWNSRTVGRSADEYIYRVIIPRELHATPVDPEVRRHGTAFADEQRFIMEQPGVYSLAEAEVDGSTCWILQLRRRRPPYRAIYRLRWRLPSRRDIATSTSPA